MKTSKKNKDKVLAKYMEYTTNASKCKVEGDIHMYELWRSKMSAVRVTLTILGIHIEGINGRDKKEQYLIDETCHPLLGVIQLVGNR